MASLSKNAYLNLEKSLYLHGRHHKKSKQNLSDLLLPLTNIILNKKKPIDQKITNIQLHYCIYIFDFISHFHNTNGKRPYCHSLIEL
jgi:hypothetical protein